MTIPRNPVPDLMKGVAVVAMIQVHIMELFAHPEIYSSTIGGVSLFLGGPFAAPVFMAVMGYFIAGSANGGREKVRRGILLLALGFLLNIGLNFHLLLKIYNGTFDLNPLEYIFGVDILFVAGLSLILIAVLEKIFTRRFIPAIVLAILVPLLSPYLPDLPNSWKYFQAFIYGDYSWSYFPVFPWFAFPLLGYGLKKFQTEYRDAWQRFEQRKTIILVIIAILLLIFFRPAYKIIIDLPSYYHHHILLFAWLTAFLVLFTWIAEIIEALAGGSRTLKYLKWLGKNVTVVYVVQWLVIGNIATAIYRTQTWLVLVIWFAAILAVTSLASYFYSRMRMKDRLG